MNAPRNSPVFLKLLLGALCASAAGFALERPPVFHLQEQDLPWKPFAVEGLPAGLMAKALSRDPQSGAASLLVYYPAGWKHEEQGYHSGAEEIFVLEGDLAMGARNLGRRFYIYIPPGVSHGPRSTRDGCVALVFLDRAPDFIPDRQPRPGACKAKALALDGACKAKALALEGGRVQDLVEPKNYFEENWTLGLLRSRAPRPPALLIKMLRQDSQTGARTWIAAVLGGRPDDQWEVHPTWEEGYLLEGETTINECLPEGVRADAYRPGGYFLRPPGIAHGGPIPGPPTYAIWFFRTPAKLDVQYFREKGCPRLDRAAAPHKEN